MNDRLAPSEDFNGINFSSIALQKKEVKREYE